MITVTHTRDEVTYENRHVWSFRTVAESDDSRSPAVFVYKNVSNSADGEALGSFFLGIASVDQMENLTELSSEDMYRTSSVDINARSDDEREILIDDINRMVDEYNTQADAWVDLKNQEFVTIE